MNVVIIGNGKVGRTIAERLCAEKHDIAIIDPSSTALQAAVNELDVMGVCGNGASSIVQEEAGVANADLLIAATSSDELNMLCCLLGRKLGAKSTVARVRNPEYTEQSVFLKEDLGISMTINPEHMAATEISRLLRFPSAGQIDTFANGKIELVELTVQENSPLHGVTLKRLPDLTGSRVLVCAVQRGGEVFIPDGEFMLSRMDKINVTAAPAELQGFMKDIGMYRERVRSAMIIGGGRIAYYLARQLGDVNMSLKIIEKNRDRALFLSENLPNVSVICGDGTDLDLLSEEGVTATDAFLALTNIDEQNMILSLYAAKRRVPKVIAKVNSPTLSNMLSESGIETIISPKNATADVIVRYSRAMANSSASAGIETLHKLLDDRVEALEFVAGADSRVIGVPLKNLRLKKDLLIATIMHWDIPVRPRGDSVICEGDSVIVVTTSARLNTLDDILA